MTDPMTGIEVADDAVRRAEMDLAISQRGAVLATIAANLDALTQRLAGAGFRTRATDGELSIVLPSRNLLKVSRAYAGGEHCVAISGVGVARITPALQERQPTCVGALAEIIVGISVGSELAVYRDPGGVLLGLELGDYLFGERPAATGARGD